MAKEERLALVVSFRFRLMTHSIYEMRLSGISNCMGRRTGYSF